MVCFPADQCCQRRRHTHEVSAKVPQGQGPGPPLHRWRRSDQCELVLLSSLRRKQLEAEINLKPRPTWSTSPTSLSAPAAIPAAAPMKSLEARVLEYLLAGM